MVFKIKDTKFIKTGHIITEYIRCPDVDKALANALVFGLTNLSKVNSTMTFDIVDFININETDEYGYFIIENDLGAFMVREDNLESIEEPTDVLDKYGFTKLIRNGNKTILFNEDGKKFTTTRQPLDEDDPEKAIMVLLLKAFGMDIRDIYKFVDLII